MSDTPSIYDTPEPDGVVRRDRSDEHRESRSTIVLAVVLVLMLLMLCGLAFFYVKVVNPPTKDVEITDPDAKVKVEEIDQYFGFGPASKERFQNPHDVAVAPNGDFIVTDGMARNLVRLTKQGAKVAVYHGGVWGQGKLDCPVGVCVGEDGRIYVTDSGNDGAHGQLVIMSPDMKTVTKQVFYEPDNPPLIPRILNGELYVTSRENVRVYDLEGKKLREWGAGFGKRPEDFAHPNGIARLSTGTIVVTDSLNRRMKYYTDRGRLLSTVGTPPVDMYDRAKSQFELPAGIAIDEHDMLVIVDTFANALDLRNPDGTRIQLIGDTESISGAFYRPTGIAYEGNDTYLVTDQLNHRVVRVRFDIPANLRPGGGKGANVVLGEPSTWIGPWCLWCLPLLVLLLLVLWIVWRAARRRREEADRPLAEA